jgi:alpha-1,6-mannosyltransferase
LIDAANRRGHYIRLVVPGERDRVEEIGEFGRIYYVRSPRAPFNSDYRVIYPGQYLTAGSAVQKILITERPDVVEICDKYTLAYLGILLRRGLLQGYGFRPVVVGLSCERMDDNFRSYVGRLPLSRSFCAAFMKWLYFPFFDHHITNSKYTAEELRAASRGQEITRHVWIRPMGVALSDLSPARRSCEGRQRLLEKCGGRKDSVLLVYAGRLAPEKNLQLLFDLLVQIASDASRDYRLLVAGDGIERGRWEAFCQKHVAGRAAFLGHIKDRNEFADLLANADAFVHPNPDEPFGIAPLEAMASGLPLVAPNRGGVTSYASVENAWITEPSAERFTLAVEELVANESERSRRVQNALRTAGEYSWESVAPLFLDLYSKLQSTSMNKVEELPHADFVSTPMNGLRLAWFRGISQCAEKTFRAASEFFSRSSP